MFKVNEYKIVFKRIWHSRKPDNGRYDTKCEIYIKDLEVPRFTGIARLHPNDRPDKIIGKKSALRNAMRDCGHTFNKGLRTAIWKAFWEWVESWQKDVVIIDENAI